MINTAPLIITLKINREAFHFFNGLRYQHFPQELNYLSAHLTLFHNLPADQPQIVSDIQQWCAQQKTITLQVTSVVSIGKGVAYKIESDTLLNMQQALQNKWKHWLIPQDQQKLWPHITVQNKVLPEQAQTLLQQLSSNFTPFEAYGRGICLWQYLGGPWKFMQTFSFDI